MRFEVSTKAIRQALTAVLPVAASKLEQLQRVRFEVAEHTMFVSATNNYSAIVCEVGVDVWDGHPGGQRMFELTTADAKKVLDVHRMPSGEGITPEDVRLMVTVTGESWRSEDTSGLFAAAEALEMPLAPHSEPVVDVTGMVGEVVAAWCEAAGGAESVTFDHAPVTVALAPFDKAQKAYDGEPMVVRLSPNRRAALVTIGDDVIGVATTHDITSDVYREHEGGARWLRAWARWTAVLPTEQREDLHIAGPKPVSDSDRGEHPTSGIVTDLAARRAARRDTDTDPASAPTDTTD